MRIIKRIAFIVFAILLILPLSAFQTTGGFNWGLEDFIAAAILLGGAGGGIGLVLKKVTNPKFRYALIIGIVVILILVWAQLAVGIIPVL